MNKPVNFEIAKLLKEKGFEQKEMLSYLLVPFWECTTLQATSNLGYGDRIGFYIPNKTVNAPTIAEVVMWLYEKHKIWIHCEICFDGNSFIPKITKVVENLYPFDTQFKSPTEAYEAAITYVLENLI